jgi:alkanesulfonate monooxygenase SsuD/methylene tetrahydromethanopterin reductase-like flavin-dependent oxidoreductase (luciferase family)
MTDYGHPLLFGSFLTPLAADPEHVVGLAQRCERLGLDLVTVQDHPYQPRFLDTWTLLSYIAARTRSVRLAANVTNLPLRPPAVLARSVASLDLLSGGRVELGLGAGAFWEAIEAMGGRRLPGGQGVRALEEAIDVIRQVWDAGARGGVRVEGEFHRVVGAKRGPAPAHDVGIWLGAYKPRMLALTGRAADGWLPSLANMQPGDLATGNAIIDDAAREAGRSPRDIRRLLNVGVDQSAEQLAGLALDHGISAFILAGDDPGDLHRFAEEVAPAVRELVSAESSTKPQAPMARSGGFTVVPTPDDGFRRSATRVWDESARPTGPAPDPDRTYTPHELAGGQHLIDVHDHLRSELARVRDLVEQVVSGAVDAGAARSHIQTMTLRQNNWTVGTYCESYCRVVTMHHTLEDQTMFPRLRWGDPRLAPVVERLQEEHHAIHEVLERVDRALVAFVAGQDGDALRAAVDLLTDTLLSHLAYEERELVEPIARLGIG